MNRKMLVKFFLAFAFASANGKCNNGIYIDEVYYEKSILVPWLQRVYHLNIEYETETLYFSHTGESPGTPGSPFTAHKTGRYNLKRNQLLPDLGGSNDGKKTTINKENKVLYTATGDGIYAYRYGNNTNDRYEYYALQGVNVFELQMKNDFLYYTEYHGNKMCVYLDGESKTIEELENSQVWRFYVDREGDITFYNFSGLYTLIKGERSPKSYGIRFGYDQTAVTAITADLNGNIYVCCDFGVYKVRKDQLKVETVLGRKHLYNVGSLSGLTFDKDNNMIYANYSSIVKLVPDFGCKQLQGDDRIIDINYYY